MSAKTLFVALTTAAAVSLCSGANSAPLPAGFEMISVKLGMGDLNLTSRADARTALTRIRFAAERACGLPADARDLTRYMQRKSCVGSTVERTVTGLASPAVSAVYDDGRSTPGTYAANDRG